MIKFDTYNGLSNVWQSIISIDGKFNYLDNVYVVDILKGLIYNMGIEKNLKHIRNRRLGAMSERTEKQKDSQDAYMEKIQDIKVRVPKEYFDKIKNHATSNGLSINKLVISLLEKEIGERILSIREKNKLKKEETSKE